MEEGRRISFKTIRHLNNRVLFLGLTPGELVICVGVLLVVFFFFQFYSLPLILAFGYTLSKAHGVSRKTKRAAYEMLMKGNRISFLDETLVLENLKDNKNANRGL